MVQDEKTEAARSPVKLWKDSMPAQLAYGACGEPRCCKQLISEDSEVPYCRHILRSHAAIPGRDDGSRSSLGLEHLAAQANGAQEVFEKVHARQHALGPGCQASQSISLHIIWSAESLQ